MISFLIRPTSSTPPLTKKCSSLSLSRSLWIVPLAQSALVRPSQALDPSPSVPVVLERAGAKALFAADEFIAARISNPHTRRAYARVARYFLA